MNQPEKGAARAAGIALIWGCLCMIAGAALWASSGTDLWTTLHLRDMADHLFAASAARTALLANLTLWVIGVLLLGFGGSVAASTFVQRPNAALAAQLCFRTGVPLAILAFIVMAAILVEIGNDRTMTNIRIAEILAWIATRTDDVATALIICGGPFFLAQTGWRDWAPRFLVRWGYLAGLTVLSAPAAWITGIVPLSFVNVPVGIGWLLVAGVVLLRRSKARHIEPEAA
ncbi:MAG TPA: hypothetical protein VIC04_06845 [Terriglobia bacterium]|jgi:hypothetical protein